MMQEIPFDEYERKVRFCLQTALPDVLEDLKAPESSSVIKGLYLAGFSIADTTKMIKLTSQQLDEDLACKSQAEIWKKYCRT